MDLGAYVQIEDIDKIAKENGIEVPRLRDDPYDSTYCDIYARIEKK